MDKAFYDASADIAPIYNLLYRLGITANYTGFFYASFAAYLVLQQPERLLFVTKWLYPEVAKHYGTTWNCVERNIRTISDIAWNNNRTLLEEWAHRPLTAVPKASQFVAILSSSIYPEITA